MFIRSIIIGCALLIGIGGIIWALSFVNNADIRTIRTATPEDHIQGVITAPITIYDYSDVYCPICREMRNILHAVYKAYNPDIAWVYRHLPLASQHPVAYQPAIFAECVGELGGNGIFWGYLDTLFILESNHQLNLDAYYKEASIRGIDENALKECATSELFNNRITIDRKEALAAGALGTPFIVITNRDGAKEVLTQGLISEKELSKKIDVLLEAIENK